MTYYKDTLQAFLDDHIQECLGKLGREFDSNDFITAFRLLSSHPYLDCPMVSFPPNRSTSKRRYSTERKRQSQSVKESHLDKTLKLQQYGQKIHN